jgi:hypothetical protein
MSPLRRRMIEGIMVGQSVVGNATVECTCCRQVGGVLTVLVDRDAQSFDPIATCHGYHDDIHRSEEAPDGRRLVSKGLLQPVPYRWRRPPTS